MTTVSHKTHIGREDIEWYDGTETFERLNSTGELITMTKVGDLINVKNAPFSAVGDGVTDDSSAFIKAKAAAGTNKSIIIPYTSGGYYLSSAITFLDRQHIIGYGKPTLKTNVNSGAAIITGQYGTIENLIIDNNGGTGSGLQIKSRTIAKNLEIDGFNTAGQYGLATGANENLCRMENITITDCDDGLVIPDTSNANYGHSIDIRACDEVATSTGITIGGDSNRIDVISQSNSVGIKLLSGATKNHICLYKENNTTPGEFDSGSAGNLIIDYGTGSDYGDFTDNGTDNIVWSAKHGAGNEWIINKMLMERLEIEDRSKVGTFALSHSDDREFSLILAGTSADQTLKIAHTNTPTYVVNIMVDGDLTLSGSYKDVLNVDNGQAIRSGTEAGTFYLDLGNIIVREGDGGDSNVYTGFRIGTKFTLETGTGNILFYANAGGTSATKTIVLGTGTAPSDSPANAIQVYSADQAAGNACLHTRTENGAVIKLYQQALISDPVGGETQDAEARSAINNILDILENAGLMSST